MADSAHYEVIDGIKCYAPELALQNDGFPLEFFERLYRVEDANFWFRARNRIIQHLFKKYLNLEKPARVLELGCGTGFVLKGLSRFKNLRLSGAEIFLSGLKYARGRLPDTEFLQLDATRMPFREEFEAIGAFDVIEHIEADQLAMENVYRSLKPGGLFFVSVPQHPFLWSSSDDLACHKRRYRRGELVRKLRQTGFQVDYVSSFVFTLFPAMLLTRILHKKTGTKQDAEESLIQELSLPRPLNFIFSSLMLFDEAMIRLGFSLPWGGSLIAVARKQ